MDGPGTVLVSLPILAYIALAAALGLRRAGWRDALIRAATIWGVLVVVITEGLSMTRWLSRSSMATAWLLVDLAALIYLCFTVRRRLRQKPPASSEATGGRVTIVEGRLLAGALVIVALAGVCGLVYPPNTWDAMEYHMPRVVHWIQNRTVAFYATHYPPQIHWPPLAEFMVLQFHMLLGDDRLDNLVQWFGLVASVGGVTLLARSMGAGVRGQVLAALFCATIPQGLLEASGAKNNYVVAFWLVAFAYYLHRTRQQAHVADVLYVGAALGLAWLTKATAYPFSLAIALAWALSGGWSINVPWIKGGLIVALVSVGLNAGHLARTYSLYGSPFGPAAEFSDPTFKYTNDGVTVSGLISNISRNLALHMATPSETVNAALESGVVAVIRAVGDDPNNPRTTWPFTTFAISAMSRHEALAGNLAHLILILTAIGMMIGRRRLRLPAAVIAYSAGLVGAFVFFCAMLKWQPWHARFHLPLFVLWSPVIGLLMSRAWPAGVTSGLGALLIVLAFPVVAGNQLRPLTSLGGDRLDRYFADNRAVKSSFLAVAQFVKETGCRDIGLDAHGRQLYEYPLLVLLDAASGDRNVRDVGVTNESSAYAVSEDQFRPCVVVCLECAKDREKWEQYTWLGEPVFLGSDVLIVSSERSRQQRVRAPGGL